MSMPYSVSVNKKLPLLLPVLKDCFDGACEKHAQRTAHTEFPTLFFAMH